ncbi:MAG: recombinase family protein, partial [Polyangiales bacterium]
RLDRMTRLGIADTLETVKLLRGAGVSVHSISDGIGSIEPGEASPLKRAMQDAMLAMLAVCAQIEGLARSERVSAARERMEAEGLPWGRPANARTVDATPRVLELHAAGVSIRTIAQRANIPRSTVDRIIQASRKGPAAPTAPEQPAQVP